MRIKLPPNVEGLAPGAYWATDLPGFGLVVYAPRNGSPSVRTFVIQKDLSGRSVRIKVGRTPPLTLAEARRKARELLSRMELGEDPRDPRGASLADAVEWHLAAMRAKECSLRGIGTFEVEVRRHLGSWLGRPLAGITREDCVRLHGALSERSGPYVANRVLRHLRAAWGTAARRVDLPPCPTLAVPWNRERRRREPIPWEKLPEWRARLEALSPVARDAYLVCLLTGLRSQDLCTIRWSEYDATAGTLHRPRPKGGVDRAFTVPVARAVREILARRQAEAAPRCEYVFPGRDGRSPIRGLRAPDLPSPHRLRDTFITAAFEAGVDPPAIKVLVNHTLPGGGDVTAGYYRPSVEHLRAAVEKVAGFLLARMDGRP